MLYTLLKFLPEKEHFLTPSDIAKKLKKDRYKVSGYLEAMADDGEIDVKKMGNAKLYFLKAKANK